MRKLLKNNKNKLRKDKKNLKLNKKKTEKKQKKELKTNLNQNHQEDISMDCLRTGGKILKVYK